MSHRKALEKHELAQLEQGWDIRTLRGVGHNMHLTAPDRALCGRLITAATDEGGVGRKHCRGCFRAARSLIARSGR